MDNYLETIIFGWSGCCQKVAQLIPQYKYDDSVMRVYTSRQAFCRFISHYSLAHSLTSIDNVSAIILLLWTGDIIMPFYGKSMTIVDQIVILLTFIDNSAAMNLLLWTRNIIMQFCDKLITFTDQIVILLIFIDNRAAINWLLWRENILASHCAMSMTFTDQTVIPLIFIDNREYLNTSLCHFMVSIGNNMGSGNLHGLWV